MELGAAASEGVSCKEQRYPPTAGKAVIPCAMETWGYADTKVEALLEEFATLASKGTETAGCCQADGEHDGAHSWA